MEDFSTKSRLRRRIMHLSVAVVAVLISASTASSAQINSDRGGGDPDVDDILGVNEQGAVFAEDPPAELPAGCAFSHRNYRPEPSVRSQLGLESRSVDDLRVSRDPRGEAEFGVTLTSEELAQVSASMERRGKVRFDEVRAALVEGIGDQFVGAAWDPGGDDVLVYHSISAEARTRIGTALSPVVPQGVTITPIFVENGIGWTTAEANAKLFEDAPDAWFDPGLGIAIGGLDEACGKMVLYAHKEADIDALANQISKKIPADQFFLFALPDSYVVELSARDNHHNPHRGGTQVFIDDNEGNCTSNVPWRKGNEIWAVTAGHCVNNNSPGAGNFFTVAEEFEQGNVRIDSGGANPVVYVNYNGNIEAAVTLIAIGGNNFTHTGTWPNDAWTGMAWWQWDPNAPNAATPGIGWDANGDWVCHAGWGSRIRRCGSITNRFFIQNSGAEDIFPGHNATFVNQRQTTADGCQGDSGGTFYRNNDRTIAGLASRQFGTPAYTRWGNNCRPNTQYGHISYLRGAFGFTAPVNMS